MTNPARPAAWYAENINSLSAKREQAHQLRAAAVEAVRLAQEAEKDVEELNYVSEIFEGQPLHINTFATQVEVRTPVGREYALAYCSARPQDQERWLVRIEETVYLGEISKHHLRAGGEVIGLYDGREMDREQAFLVAKRWAALGDRSVPVSV